MEPKTEVAEAEAGGAVVAVGKVRANISCA